MTTVTDLLTLGARVKGSFYVRTDETEPEDWILKLSMQTESDSAQEEWARLNASPRLQRWDSGPRPTTRPTGDKFIVKNYDYANAVELDEPTWRRRKHGEFERHVDGLAEAAETHENEHVPDFIKTLDASYTVYDNQFFFDTDHESGKSGIQSNVVTFSTGGDPAAPTPANFSDAMFAAAKRQRKFRNDQGRPWNRGRAHYIVTAPTELLDVASTALAANLLVRGNSHADNPLMRQDRFSYELVDVPDMDDTWGTGNKSFAIWRADTTEKPFVIQHEVRTKGSAAGINEYEMEKYKKVWFGAQRAWGLGGLHWHLGVLVNFAA